MSGLNREAAALALCLARQYFDGIAVWPSDGGLIAWMIVFLARAQGVPADGIGVRKLPVVIRREDE